MSPISGGDSGGVPPLPIPNREVKPACADGTAMQCGRVGNRLFSLYDLNPPEEQSSGGFFLRLYASEAFLVLMQRHVCFHQAIIELSRQLPDGFACRNRRKWLNYRHFRIWDQMVDGFC